jgi:hypothetical protein
VSLTFHSALRTLNTEPSIGASHQVSVHLAKQFQRRRFFRNQPTVLFSTSSTISYMRKLCKHYIWNPISLISELCNATIKFVSRQLVQILWRFRLHNLSKSYGGSDCSSYNNTIKKDHTIWRLKLSFWLWTGTKNVAGLNWLMGSQPSPLDKFYCSKFALLILVELLSIIV